jgi:transposase
LLHEKAQRCWAACEAQALGRGGISLVATATGLSRPTIRRGLAELNARPDHADDSDPIRTRIRRTGGGRHRLIAGDPSLLGDLKRLVDPATRGDPMSPLLWTCKSTRHLAQALGTMGHPISHQSVGRLLTELGYNLQTNRKTEEGKDHPDRNAQFEHINRKVRSFQKRGQPVVSVDTKKKELVGNYKNPGQEWEPEGQPRRVKSKDFPDKVLGKVSPYGVYDLTTNEGWVNVGITHDTAKFAVESIRRWWSRMGRLVYPEAKELLVTADSGGSNASRSRLWKVGLQGLSDELGLKISVCHFPPGTSKWNKIEHRMFCHITENWRGRPLVSHAVVVNLIGSTQTQTGLRIQAELDTNVYD